MFNFVKDICSITDFKKNSGTILNRVIQEKAPTVLTLNGSSAVVVIDVESYQALLEAVEYTRVLKSVEQGIQEVKAGQAVPADNVFDKMRTMLNDRKKAPSNA